VTRRALVATILSIVGAGALLGALVRFAAPLTLTIELAAPPIERWATRIGPAPAVEEITLPVNGRTLEADLYRPVNPAAALLLVHGLSARGRRHPDLVRLAALFARHGQLVLVPHFGGLAAFRLSGREVEDIRGAIEELARRHTRVGVAGFSFGAGPALLAAAGAPILRLAAAFGGYADLTHVIAYITTGTHSFEGRRERRRVEEYNRWKLLALLVPFMRREPDRTLLDAVARRKLANPSAPTTTLEERLGEDGQRLLALVLNRREENVPALLAALPVEARQALDRLSPLAVVPRLRCRLVIAHGIDDDSIPYTESLRLAAAAGGRAQIAILRSFHHVGPRPLWQSLPYLGRDAWSLLRLADATLGD
jgi:hypothetical protein